MRRRNIKDANIKLESYQNYINNPKSFQGKWNTLFNNDNPIHLEIGMGKGGFIIGMAKLYPEINFIGLEKYPSVLLQALKKEEVLPNLYFINYDALNLLDIFNKSEISQIYLNFSDPWPKSGHKKRRLTHEVFLDLYRQILKPNSYIYFKTDNRKLFEFSLESINNYGLKLENICLDLHNTELPFTNIQTEYEAKFSVNGPIYRLEAKYETR